MPLAAQSLPRLSRGMGEYYRAFIIAYTIFGRGWGEGGGVFLIMLIV